MSDFKDIELNRIKQISREYENKGYKVTIHPEENSIPKFLDWYKPDLIAQSDKEIVIIGVKSREDYKSLEGLSPIIERVNKTEGWRFELVIVNKKLEVKNTEVTRLELTNVEIKGRLNRITELTKKGFFEAAFLLNWAVFESVSRRVIREDQRDISITPLSLIKTLFSYGHLNKKDYNFLLRMFQLRNELVHGYKTRSLPKSEVSRFLQITVDMLNIDSAHRGSSQQKL